MNYIRLQRHVDTVSSHCLESLRFARGKKKILYLGKGLRKRTGCPIIIDMGNEFLEALSPSCPHTIND